MFAPTVANRWKLVRFCLSQKTDGMTRTGNAANFGREHSGSRSLGKKALRVHNRPRKSLHGMIYRGSVPPLLPDRRKQRRMVIQTRMKWRKPR